MKWLIEITRNTLQNLLKEKIQQVPIIAPAKTDKPIAAVPIRVINKIGLTNLRSRSVSKPNSNTKNNHPLIQNSPKIGSREDKMIDLLNIKQIPATVNVLKDDDDHQSDPHHTDHSSSQNDNISQQQPNEQQQIPLNLENDNEHEHEVENLNSNENESDISPSVKNTENIMNYNSDPK